MSKVVLPRPGPYICAGGYPRHAEPRPAVALYYVTAIGTAVAIAYCQECDDYHRPRLPEHNARFGNVERRELPKEGT